MRKVDLFGKRNVKISLVYLLLAVFVIVMGGRFWVISSQNQKIDDLERERVQIYNQIAALIQLSQEESLHEIGEIIQFLPNTYDPFIIRNELEYVRNISNLALAQNVSVLFTNSQNPFKQTLPQSVKYVSINLTMNIDSNESLLLFMDNLIAQDRIYYINTVSMNALANGRFAIQMNIYTFYNDVNID
jgi:hypothetical protein